ncbi:uncharacterized protein ARMOST_18157 [Armillaria ostoyae]|uniref:Uncharacterized protein n=1 Tax=Armillaria ostoyae TaxID=47428 RepID=A0A284S106_ARMOS|nr:uncharacterized protein ARMOST_18157 [Armillaria ostoyae]
MSFSPVDTEPSTSHAFFTEAKHVQERNKRDVLDELLRNEDDLLFRDKQQSLDWDLDDDCLIVVPIYCTVISASLFSTIVRSDALCGDSRTPIVSTSSVSSPVAHTSITMMNMFLPPHPPSSSYAHASLDSLFDQHTEPQLPHSVVPVETSFTIGKNPGFVHF